MKRRQLFSPSERQDILHRLLDAIQSDDRVAGVVLVGSAPVGFEDEYSDIDLSVVVEHGHDVAPVFRWWQDHMKDIIPVVHSFETEYAPNNLLCGFLLDNFLEVDIGFLCLQNLVARRERWKVAFDRTGKIEGIMHTTWANRTSPDIRGLYLHLFDSIWHYIMHSAVCTERGQHLRALHYLEELRNRIVEVAGLHLGLETRNFRQADQLPPSLRSALEVTLVSKPERTEILRALKSATTLFFSEAQRLEKTLGLNHAGSLKKRMMQFLSFFG